MERRREIDQLRATNAALEVENGNFRAATGELTTQIQSLERSSTISARGPTLDPAQARRCRSCPRVVKATRRGRHTPDRARDLERAVAVAVIARRHLRRAADAAAAARESRLQLRAPRRRAAGAARRRHAVDLAGPRLAHRHVRRPRRSVHRRARLPPGPRHLDRKGQPVYATADGIVESAATRATTAT